MFDVIDINEKLRERKLAAEDAEFINKGRVFQALHADLLQTINRHMRYGATDMNILGAAAFILAAAMAKVDPWLTQPNFRDILFNFISTTTDDELLKMWMDTRYETETNSKG
jgi:hypothetical protein